MSGEELIDQNAVQTTVPEPVVVLADTALRIDLGCGQNKREGFKGVDKFEAPGVDIVHDLMVRPWPFEDGSVTEIVCSHFLEHIDGMDRLAFFDEVWRVLKTGGTAQFITPAADSNRAIQDPTHKFPPVVQEFFMCYLSREWRVLNRLTHGEYDRKCNFATTSVGAGLDVALQARNDEYRNYAMKHLRNATTDLYVTLTKLD